MAIKFFRICGIPVLALLWAASRPAFAAPGDVIWAKRLGGKGLDQGWGLAFDARGNLVLSGFGSDALDLGGGLLEPGQGDGIFAAAFSPTGAHLWSWRKPLGRSYFAGPLAVDASGAALLIGNRGPDFFVYRVAEGRLERHLDLPLYRATGYGVATLGDDIVFVGYSRVDERGFVEARAPDDSVRFKHTMDGRPIAVAPAGDGQLAIAGSRDEDIFVEKQSTGGTITWTRRLGKPGIEEVRVQIAVAPGGDVVAGYGSHPFTVTRLAAATGNVLWSTELGGLNVDGVAVGPGGETVVSGDAEVTRLDARGQPLWRRALKATKELSLRGVAVDGQGHACVSGWFAGTFAAGAKIKKLKSVGEDDALIVCLSL